MYFIISNLRTGNFPRYKIWNWIAPVYELVVIQLLHRQHGEHFVHYCTHICISKRKKDRVLCILYGSIVIEKKNKIYGWKQ